MPYQCARAVCATFCYNISGALIPIFGPDFPSLCTQVDAPEYSRMVIDQAIVIQSTQEADSYRYLYSNAASSGFGARSRNDDGNISPKRDRRVFRSPYDDTNRHHPRYRVRKTYATTPGSGNSPYTTDTDGEISPITDRTSQVRDPPPQLTRLPHSQMPSMIVPLRHGHIRNSSSGWTPANTPHSSTHPRPHTEYHTFNPSPWLSAVPRFTTAQQQASSSYLNTNVPIHPRSQPYPATHPSSQPQSHFHSNPQTYHSSSSAHVRQSSSSDAPLRLSQEVSHQSLQSKRPAAHIEDDRSLDTRHAEMALRQIHRVPLPNHTNKDNRSDAQSTHERENDRATGASNAGADNKAALLLMNLSVRESSFRKSSRKSSRKSRYVEGASDVTIHYEDVNSRYNCNDSGGYVSRYQTGAGIGAGAAVRNVDGGGVSSETTSPFDRAFPRIKRVRSNSM